jgi:hypothetical protein
LAYLYGLTAHPTRTVARRHLRRGSRLSEDQLSLAATVRCRNSDTGTRVGPFFAVGAGVSPGRSV